MLLMYLGWAVYFISQLVTYRRKRIHLKFQETEENRQLRYQYKTEYYKYVLMLLITLIEGIAVALIMAKDKYAFLHNILHTNKNSTLHHIVVKVTIITTINSLRFIAGLATVSFVNILTIYMSYVCRSYTEFSPIKKRIQNCSIVIILLLLLTLLTLVGAVLAQLFSIIIGIYEYIQLIKNSKFLYDLLKWRYRNLINDNQYYLYQKHKKLAVRYKWFTILLLIALFGFMIAMWLDWLEKMVSSIHQFSRFEPFIRMEKRTYEIIITVIHYSMQLVLYISLGIYIINIMWITLTYFTHGKKWTISFRKRRRNISLTEPLLS